MDSEIYEGGETMIKKSVLYIAICDGCEKKVIGFDDIDGGSAKKLKANLKATGWSSDFKFCPDCKLKNLEKDV